MKWTKILALLLALCMLSGISALAVDDTADEAESVIAEATAETAEESTEETAAEPEGDVYTGSWIDVDTHLVNLTAAWTGEAYEVRIVWTRTADTADIWEITGSYDEENDQILYQDGLWNRGVRGADGTYEESTLYIEESGAIMLRHGNLFWIPDRDEGEEEIVIFERARTESDAAPFADVGAADWYRDAVDWGYKAYVVEGVSETEFSPAQTVTRAQAVTFLWRMIGQPVTNQVETFDDVEKGSWYETAVQWAVKKDVTVGTGDHKFSPTLDCTRGQILTFLYRFFGEPALRGANLFTDVDPDAYYGRAVIWASQAGIITEDTNGPEEGIFAPDAPCTRADMVSFLYHAMLYRIEWYGVGFGVDEDGEEIQYDLHPEAGFTGDWAEEIAGRGVVTIEAAADEYYFVYVGWSSSAFEKTFWFMTAKYDEGELVYEDAVMWTRTYTSEEEYEDVTEYEDGSGRFYVEDGKLVWIDDKGNVDAETRFVKIAD